MTTETTTAAAAPTAADIKARFKQQKERANTAATSLQALVPVNGLSEAGQSAFLLAMSTFQTIGSQLEEAEKKVNGVAIFFASQEETEAAGGLVEQLAEMAKEIAEAVVEQFGVSDAAMRASLIPDVVYALDQLDVAIARVESLLAETSK